MLKDTVIQIERALSSDRLRDSKVFGKFRTHSVTRKINHKSISHTNTNNALRNDKKMSQTS